MRNLVPLEKDTLPYSGVHMIGTESWNRARDRLVECWEGIFLREDTVDVLTKNGPSSAGGPSFTAQG